MAELPLGDAVVGRVFIALGTNLAFEGRSGPALLAHASDLIAAQGVTVIARSSFYESPAWPAELADQPPYVNAVAEVAPGALGPEAVYEVLASVEKAFGRERRTRWAARTLDLDIIDFRGLVQEGDGLILPHPRAHQRAFVLVPLAEMTPGWRHPILGQSASELVAGLEKTDAASVHAIRRLSVDWAH